MTTFTRWSTFFKSLGITSVLANEVAELFEKARYSSHGISFIADYEKEIKEFEITTKGMVIKD